METDLNPLLWRLFLPPESFVVVRNSIYPLLRASMWKNGTRFSRHGGTRFFSVLGGVFSSWNQKMYVPDVQRRVTDHADFFS